MHRPPMTPLAPRSFFEDYKKNEHKEVIVDEFLGAEDAKRVIRESLVRARAAAALACTARLHCLHRVLACPALAGQEGG